MSGARIAGQSACDAHRIDAMRNGQRLWLCAMLWMLTRVYAETEKGACAAGYCGFEQGRPALYGAGAQAGLGTESSGERRTGDAPVTGSVTDAWG